MLTAAKALFLSGGYDAVTANAVAREAGVAVGTIYGRFGNKDGLVQAVQVVLLKQFEEAVSVCEASPEWTQTQPNHIIRVLIVSLAQLLTDHADILTPVMRHASTNPETALLGKSSYENMRLAFLRAACRAEPLIRHPDPAGTINSCFTIAYATFARTLGLGSSPEAADAASLPVLAKDLGAMCEAFLFHGQAGH